MKSVCGISSNCEILIVNFCGDNRWYVLLVCVYTIQQKFLKTLLNYVEEFDFVHYE